MIRQSFTLALWVVATFLLTFIAVGMISALLVSVFVIAGVL